MTQAISLATAVGKRMAALRARHGKRQEDVAGAARMLGLGWTRATVAGIELGRQGLPAEQFALIPDILTVAFGRGIGMRDLIGGRTRIALAPGAFVTGDELAEKLAGAVIVPEAPRLRRRMQRQLEQYDEAEWRGIVRRYRRLWPKIDTGRLTVAFIDAGGEAEQRAASRLGSHPAIVAIAAHRTWGRSLSAERDRLVAEQAGKGASARTLQALRGHVTRNLTEELRPLVAELTARDKAHAERDRPAGRRGGRR